MHTCPRDAHALELGTHERELANLREIHDKQVAAAARSTQQVASITAKVHKVEDHIFTHFCAKMDIPNIRVYEDTEVQSW